MKNIYDVSSQLRWYTICHARSIVVEYDSSIHEANDEKSGSIHGQGQANDSKGKRRKDWRCYERKIGVERCWDGQSRVEATIGCGCLRHG